jgi:hypothetical protein
MFIVFQNNVVDSSYSMLLGRPCVATLLWPSVGMEPNTWKKLGLESSGTPENSEDDLEDQNTSHWGCSWCHWKGLET